MRKQNGNANMPLKKRKDIIAKKPTFEKSLIPVAGGQSASRYRDFVYTENEKLITILGVEPSERGLFPSTPTRRKDLCDKFLGYLLVQTTGPRTQHGLEFRQKLIKQLDSKFDKLKKSVDEECPSVCDAESRVSLIKAADGESKRKLLLQKQVNSKAIGSTGMTF
jgi:hypothetical protein